MLLKTRGSSRLGFFILEVSVVVVVGGYKL
jgi:hypothetical protein